MWSMRTDRHVPSLSGRCIAAREGNQFIRGDRSRPPSGAAPEPPPGNEPLRPGRCGAAGQAVRNEVANGPRLKSDNPFVRSWTVTRAIPCRLGHASPVPGRLPRTAARTAASGLASRLIEEVAGDQEQPENKAEHQDDGCRTEVDAPQCHLTRIRGFGRLAHHQPVRAGQGERVDEERRNDQQVPDADRDAVGGEAERAAGPDLARGRGLRRREPPANGTKDGARGRGQRPEQWNLLSSSGPAGGRHAPAPGRIRRSQDLPAPARQHLSSRQKRVPTAGRRSRRAKCPG
jgi:hypothetical protein